MADPAKDVPRDLWVEILSRLPVKDLLRIKSVCKKWRSLVSDAKFIEAQCHRSNNRYSLLIFEDLKPILEYSSKTLTTNEHAEIANPPYWSEDLNTRECKILGSCDGLLFVSYHDELLLWNPAARRRRRIQCSAEHALLRWRHISGMGRDSRNGNYKAVMTFKCEKSYRGPPLQFEGLATYVICFSTGRCFKSEVDTCPYMLPYDLDPTSRGVIVNGDPHWVLTRKCDGRTDFSQSYSIVSFDMRDDRFKELQQHDSWAAEASLQKLELGVSRGQLCAFYRLKNGITEVWAMKEYGVNDSWVQLFVVEDNWKAMCFTCNNDMLLESNNYRALDRSMLLRNFESGTTTNLTLSHNSPLPPLPLHIHVSAYAESLVWIDGPIDHYTYSFSGSI